MGLLIGLVFVISVESNRMNDNDIVCVSRWSLFRLAEHVVARPPLGLRVCAAFRFVNQTDELE